MNAVEVFRAQEQLKRLADLGAMLVFFRAECKLLGFSLFGSWRDPPQRKCKLFGSGFLSEVQMHTYRSVDVSIIRMERLIPVIEAEIADCRAELLRLGVDADVKSANNAR